MRALPEDLRYHSLYLVAFANWFGLSTITTLLPTYIDLLEPSGSRSASSSPGSRPRRRSR